MSIPLGFGKGQIGRALLKQTTPELQAWLTKYPKPLTGCGYDVMAWNVHKLFIEAVLKRRL